MTLLYTELFIFLFIYLLDCTEKRIFQWSLAMFRWLRASVVKIASDSGQACSCRGQLSSGGKLVEKARSRRCLPAGYPRVPFFPTALPHYPSFLLSRRTNNASFTRAIPSAPRVPEVCLKLRRACQDSGHQLHFPAAAWKPRTDERRFYNVIYFFFSPSLRCNEFGKFYSSLSRL